MQLAFKRLNDGVDKKFRSNLYLDAMFYDTNDATWFRRSTVLTS